MFTAYPTHFQPLRSIHYDFSGLAIASLVLGVASVAGCSIISGIPAIITGHIALNRTRKFPHQFGGGGLAVAALVLGYLSLVMIPILAGLMLPALAKAKEKARRILAEELHRLGWRPGEMEKRLKADPDKVRIARRLRGETTMTLKWIAGQLQMGSWTYLSNNLTKTSPIARTQ